MMTDLATSGATHGIDITAVTRLKHADLYAAANRLGSQSALARHLGIQPSELGEWINLKRCPPADPIGTRWTEGYLLSMQSRLLELTGKDWEELFPQHLRDNVQFLDCRKTIEQTRRVEAEALCSYAIASSERLARISNDESAPDLPAVLEKAMHCLSSRECKVLSVRFGLWGHEPHTLEAAESVFNVSRERIRQIEGKAIHKLQSWFSLHADVRFDESFTGMLQRVGNNDGLVEINTKQA